VKATLTSPHTRTDRHYLSLLIAFYRIFITPKNIVFGTIEILISGDSSSGKLITSDILSYLMSGLLIIRQVFLFGVWGTTYVYYLFVS